MTSRFTRDGSPSLEQHLTWVCDQVRTNIDVLLPRTVLDGVLLTGAYGRGEGGVLHGFNDSPFDAMDFVVLVRGQAESEMTVLGQVLRELATRLSPFAGTEIRFRLESRAKLKKRKIDLRTYELVAAHRWIIGSETLLTGCEHHLEATKIPLEDASHLLLDRCSQLLLAKDRLRKADFTIEDAAFVTLSVARAQLALGDASLIARHKYAAHCAKRVQHIDAHALPKWGWQVAGHYAQGIDFQMHPRFVAESQESLWKWHEQVSDLASQVWLWLEEVRLQQRFASVRNYAVHTATKCPENNALQNMLTNLRTFGRAGLTSKWWLRHPRERLMRTMPLLLWAMDELGDHALVASCFDVMPEVKNTAITLYHRLWTRLASGVLEGPVQVGT